MSTRSQKARQTADEALVHDGNLKEVLGKRSRLQVIVIRLANSPQEAHWTGPSELELEHAKHEAFGLEDLIDRVAAIDHVNNLLN